MGRNKKRREIHKAKHKCVCLCVRLRVCMCVCVHGERERDSGVGITHSRLCRTLDLDQIQENVHKEVCVCARVVSPSLSSPSHA